MVLKPASFISSSEFVKLPICQVPLILKNSPVGTLSQELESQGSPTHCWHFLRGSKWPICQKRVHKQLAVPVPNSTYSLRSARPGLQRLIVLVSKPVGASVSWTDNSWTNDSSFVLWFLIKAAQQDNPWSFTKRCAFSEHAPGAKFSWSWGGPGVIFLKVSLMTLPGIPIEDYGIRWPIRPVPAPAT